VLGFYILQSRVYFRWWIFNFNYTDEFFTRYRLLLTVRISRVYWSSSWQHVFLCIIQIQLQTCRINITKYNQYFVICFFLWPCGPTRSMASTLMRFLDHTQRRTRVGRTPLDEWSARRRDLYLTTHNTHNRQTSMPPAGFELTISAGEWPQTYALDRAATGTGYFIILIKRNDSVI